MTIAISCNLPDGVILGVDSAVTLASSKGVLKVYENAEKLFQLSKKPIGIATYGIAGIGDRNIGNYINEFERIDPSNVVSQSSTVKEVTEELRKFFLKEYIEKTIPTLEKLTGKKIEDIPDNEKPFLGLIVGGFSSNEYSSEIWNIQIPFHNKINSSILVRDKGQFSVNWFALCEPIQRYFKGIDPNLLEELIQQFTNKSISQLLQADKDKITSLLNKYEYKIPFNMMPIKEGVAFVKFLVKTGIKHYRFVLGSELVGGNARIGLVTYKGDKFQILNED